MGEKLRRLRLEQRWSLAALAEQVGSSKAHLSNLENGRAGDPSVRLLGRVADFFGVSLDYLLDPRLAIPDSREDAEFIAHYRAQPEDVRARLRAAALAGPLDAGAPRRRAKAPAVTEPRTGANA